MIAASVVVGTRSVAYLRRELDATAAALMVANRLRDSILSGQLPPATRLREVAVAAELGVSRNTLREALRQLAVEGLVEQPFYKGAIVRTMTAAEVCDIYRIRRVLELNGIEASAKTPSSGFGRLKQAHAALQAAATRKVWQEVATSGLHFHQAIVGFIGSRKLDDFFRVIAAQLRLAFMTAPDEKAFHTPWAPRDREICDLILAGERAKAKLALAHYLADAEQALLDLMKATEARSMAK